MKRMERLGREPDRRSGEVVMPTKAAPLKIIPRHPGSLGIILGSPDLIRMKGWYNHILDTTKHSL